MAVLPTALSAPTATGPGSQGAGALTGGYGAAISNLANSLQNTQNLYAGQQNQAGQQLQQNQGRVQQGLVNSGLGNTTVAQTMQQAPLQTYNNAMLNLTGAQNQATSQGYGQLAGMQAQGGQATANYMAPFVQSQYIQNQQQQQAAKQNQAQGAAVNNGLWAGPGSGLSQMALNAQLAQANANAYA